MNLKRGPLSGRSADTWAEDPCLTGALAAAFLQGVQSAGVGGCAGRLAVVNQETDRRTLNRRVDERTLQELYLPAFETAVRDGQPRAVVCSAGQLNGTRICEDTALLTDTLRTGTVQEPAAATAEPAGSDRAAKGTPTPADWEYEAQINENSLENYVKRLYYYVEDNAAPAKSEVDFWVQALREKDVTPAVLGQSFLFAADKANTYTDAQAFYTEASLVLFGTDVTVGNADAYLPYFAEGGAVQAYKQLFSLPSCQEQFAGLGVEVGAMDDRIPLDRTALAEQVEAARATRATQSTVDAGDKETYTPGYILRHPAATALLFVRSVVKNGDHYIRTLVGGSLSYYTVELAWGWVAVLYLLLAYAALPVQGAKQLLTGRARGWCCAAAALCCLLTVAGCLLWTPIRYETLYGLQGRYFLPILPLLLLACLPRRLATVPDEGAAQDKLTIAIALVQAGVVVNSMLAIIAR